MKSCENCDWRSYNWSFKDDGIHKQIKEGMWCYLPENLFSFECPCELWQEQKYPVPRGDWVGPTWNY